MDSPTAAVLVGTLQQRILRIAEDWTGAWQRLGVKRWGNLRFWGRIDL